MESLGDYTYIIMIAVALISGILKSIKKKQEVANYPYPEHDSTDEYGDEYKDIFADEINTVDYPQTETLENSSATEKVNYQTTFTSLEGMSHYDNTKDITKLRGKKEIIKMKPTRMDPLSETEPLIPAYNFDNTEKVRAAFIASEIFNRKY